PIRGEGSGCCAIWRRGCRASSEIDGRSRAPRSRDGKRFNAGRWLTKRRVFIRVAPLAAERRLITVGHSYVVAENRRLAHEIALAGRGRWQVTAIAPSALRGDLRRIELEPIPDEACTIVPLKMAFDRSAHLMAFRGLRRAMSGGADVVHAWEEPYVRAGAQIARCAPDSSRVVFATFQNIRKRYPWPFRAFERSSMRRASGWIAFGHRVADALGDRSGYAGKPMRVIPPGVDVERF